jgi:mRNA interferase RelE/StbE
MAEWSFRITPEAERDIDRLDIQIKRRVVEKLRWFVENFDHVTPLPLGEPMRGFFKLRVGDWRVIYEVESSGEIIVIHSIDRRDKIYQRKK